MEVLSNIPVELETEVVLSHLRVGKGSEDADRARELLDIVREMVNPKAIYDLCAVDEKGSDTVEIDGVVFTSRVLRVNLEEAHRVFPHVATCGRELEEVPGVAGDPLLEYWLEELKVMALAAAGKHLREHIDAKYKPGKMSGMAPGSLEDWPVTQQKQLFSLLGDVEGKIGVRLTDSFLMLPLKSVSGLLFPTETSFESCLLCPRKVCPGRRARYDPDLWEERYAKKR
ncbi:MAG: vitamin B12 dependent methionine synthase [Armatimonadota bacterium]|nr:MAG: vitamin B12 dependent methionine synthase [Armatimonadota bacterium]